MIFANVTDISIPEGNVIKIHETNGGRVLWEKKKKVLSAHWELSVYDADTASTNTSAMIGHWLDNGSELIMTYIPDNDDPNYEYYRYYNPVDNTFSSIHKMNLPSDFNEEGSYPTVTDWAIDPVTKVWCSTATPSSANCYYCNAFNDNTFRSAPTNVSRCCWSEALKRFCLTGSRKSYLMDTEGNIYEKDNSTGPGRTMPYATSSFVLCAGDGNTKFIAYNAGLNQSDSIVISPDGYEWTYIHKISDDLPDSTSRYDRGLGVTWVPPLNAYVAIVGNSSGYYVFKSADGINWTQISTIPVTENNTFESTYERCVFGEYSPEKNIIAFVISKAAYISEDCLNWIEIPLQGTGVPVATYAENYRKTFMWSKSFNAFLYGTPRGKFRKLVID